jgi:FAD-linked oxidoreductase
VPRWSNWADNQHTRPAAVAAPRSDSELVTTIKDASAKGLTVKVRGSGHSFTDIACTLGVHISLENYRRVLSVSEDELTVTVQAGIRLKELNRTLTRRGLALSNLGDVAYQTISGAISTSTHGTGADHGGLATQVVALDLVTADGSVVSCSHTEEPEIFKSAQVGLGALGAISTVTVQCVPAFDLYVVEEPMTLADVLRDFDAHVRENDYFEFFWIPHTKWTLTKRHNRCEERLRTRGAVRHFRDKVLLENVAFGALCRAGRMVPSAIPRLNHVIPAVSSRTEYVDRSDRVFTTPRLVHFCEMEYSIPISSLVEAFGRVVDLVERRANPVSFPVEVRVSCADDIPLSTASGRSSAYIAVHAYKGMPYEEYFEGVESILDRFDGRPHWGKLHYQTAGTLAPKYAGWNSWQYVRGRLDPNGTFTNAYTERVLGAL